MLIQGGYRSADGGTRTRPPLSGQRILSPLRLPFRHIGIYIVNHPLTGTCILKYSSLIVLGMVRKSLEIVRITALTALTSLDFELAKTIFIFNLRHKVPDEPLDSPRFQEYRYESAIQSTF